jgi:CBS domain-containing protein
MIASDVMSTEVVSAGPDMPVRDVARLLLAHGISAVPVLDPDGAVIGMVSEGDLVGRGEMERLARQDWWLRLLADGAQGDNPLLRGLGTGTSCARDVMTSPVVTVSDTTDLREIARLLSEHHIKRVPVLRDGKVVGIVSRADLLRAVASVPTEPMARPAQGHGPRFFRNLFGEYQRPAWENPGQATSLADLGTASHDPPKAELFRHLVGAFRDHQARERQESRKQVEEHNQQHVNDLLRSHVTAQVWSDLMQRAHDAAATGQKEFLLLRFPNQLCSDGGRAIDVAEESWPGTLRGGAAEMYLRWERELKPNGFGLSARVLEYPGGKPGDIGLFLVWGE